MTPYVDRVLHCYRTLPDTLGHVRHGDRQLACDLEQRAVPLALVEAALCLAALRRRLRPSTAPPLPPIRSLHYIQPILHELQLSPPDPDYLVYLHDRLRRLTHTSL